MHIYVLTGDGIVVGAYTTPEKARKEVDERKALRRVLEQSGAADPKTPERIWKITGVDIDLK